MTTFDDLRAKVEANQDVVTVRMEELRDAMNVKRLGIHVCQDISKKLAGVGLGHTPELEPDGWQEVRLYKLGTPMADLIVAALNPGDAGDNALREKSASEASETLEHIRSLVCA